MATSDTMANERAWSTTAETVPVPALRRWSRRFDRWLSRQRVSHEDPLDSEIAVVSPENIAFKYRVAGFFPRSLAFLADVVICTLLMICFSVLFLLLGALGDMVGLTALFQRLSMIFQSLMLVLWFVLYWFYVALLETFMNGQTLGKRLMGLRVLSSDGSPINGSQAVLRGVMRAADCLPWVSIQIFDPWVSGEFDGAVPWYPIFPTFLVAFMAMTLTNRYQRLGDLVCGTMVVRETKTWGHGLAKFEDPRVPHLAEFIPPGFVIGQSLSQALAAYVDRRRFFSVPRRREIAAPLAEPLLEKFGLPEDTGYDLFLCAMYYRAFIADQGQEDALDLRLNPELRQFEGIITQQLALRLQDRGEASALSAARPASSEIEVVTDQRVGEQTSSPLELGMAAAASQLTHATSDSVDELKETSGEGLGQRHEGLSAASPDANPLARGEATQEGDTNS